MTVGEKIKHRRRAIGLTQAEVARSAGLTEPSVNRIEKGITRHPQQYTLSKIAEVLGCTVESLSDDFDDVVEMKKEAYITITLSDGLVELLERSKE